VPKPISPTALVEKVRSMVRPVAGADQYAAVARRPHRHAGGRLKGLFRGALRDGNVPVGRSADQIESPDQSTLAGGRGSLEADDPRTR
jgi:hypothetical protein